MDSGDGGKAGQNDSLRLGHWSFGSKLVVLIALKSALLNKRLRHEIDIEKEIYDLFIN